MKLSVINDTHIGAQRSAGTTPTTAWELRRQILSNFKDLLDLANGGDLLINGDLFDKYSINYMDLLQAFTITSNWLVANPASTLYLSAGNHDLSTNSTKLSSFEFFADLLVQLYSTRVVKIKGSANLGLGRYVISHVPNQDLFNMELESVPSDTNWLFLHCNYDNHFAAEADHSLNISEEQAAKICANGANIILAHEHQHKIVQFGAGYLYVVGNQIPTSVADCLGNDDKRMVVIGADNKSLEEVIVWEAETDFARLDWREVADYTGPARFIRVEGSAQASEANVVVSTISKFRNNSTALVVTNSVRIETEEGFFEFDQAAEEVKSFQVLDALLAMLTEEEAAVVKNVLKD